VDSGIATGQDISPYYDPMVAKIIASGPTRDIARLRLIEALQQTVLFGPRHNRDFLIACLQKACFAEGRATTAFIAEEFVAGEIGSTLPEFADSAVAAVIELTLDHQSLYAESVLVAPQLKDWSSASPLISRKRYQHGDRDHDLAIMALGDNRYRVFDSAASCQVELLALAQDTAHVGVDGGQHIARFHAPQTGKLYLSIDGRAAEYRDLIRLDGIMEQTGGGGSITAPMHGLLLEVRVVPGDAVAAGQTLAILEAMKMHYEIVAEAAGTVSAVLAEAGTQVAVDDLLLAIDVTEEA
jgi:geranyl-CoA carboxylase alpha subunit